MIFVLVLLLVFSSCTSSEQILNLSDINQSNLNSQYTYNFIYHSNSLIFGDLDGVYVYALNSETLKKLSGTSGEVDNIMVYNNSMYFVSDSDTSDDFKSVYYYDAEKNKSVKILDVSWEALRFRIVDNVLYYHDSIESLKAYNLKNSSPLEMELKCYSSYEICDDIIYYNTVDGYIMKYDINTGGISRLCETTSDKLYMYNHELYFIDYDFYFLTGKATTGYLCKITEDGIKKVIKSIPVKMYTAMNNKLYYVSNNCLYMYNLNDGNEERIYESDNLLTAGIYSFDDKIFCPIKAQDYSEANTIRMICCDTIENSVEIVNIKAKDYSEANTIR